MKKGNTASLGKGEAAAQTNSAKKEGKSHVKVKSDYVRGKCDGEVCTFEAGEDVFEADVEGEEDVATNVTKSSNETTSSANEAEEEEVEAVLAPQSQPIPAAVAPTRVTTTAVRVDESRLPAIRYTPSRAPVTRGVLTPPSLIAAKEAKRAGLHASEGKVCVNQEGLRFKPDEYADVDIVIYDDSKGLRWCWTSEDYEGLLEQKINPDTNERLPLSVVDEIAVKLNLLKTQALKVDPTDAGTGVRRLRKGGYASDNLSAQRIQRLKDYYVLAGLNPDYIIGVYTIQDMQNILDALYDPSPQLDQTSRAHATNSYASAITRDIESADDPQERLAEIGTVIGQYSDTDLPVEVEEPQ